MLFQLSSMAKCIQKRLPKNRRDGEMERQTDRKTYRWKYKEVDRQRDGDRERLSNVETEM